MKGVIQLKRMKRIILFTLLIIFSISIVPFSCYADTSFSSYNSYIYNEKSDAVSIPNCFLPKGFMNGDSWSVGALNSPEDMMADDSGRLFISDTGNNRIVLVESDYKTASVLSKFTYQGEELTLNAPLGVYATNKKIYICDSGNNRVLVSDFDGRVSLVLKKPTSKEFEQELDFVPRKVAADKYGNVYVLCNNVYSGAVVFTQDGVFDGFFGSNSVRSTAEIVIQRAFKKIMGKEQRRKMAKYVPAEFENLTVRDNFVYTVSYQTNTSSVDLNNAIRKLNPAGNNVTNTTVSFGDLDMYYDYDIKGTVYTRFCDLYVDDDSYIYALDSTNGKIFVYDSDYHLLCAFSGLGEQAGLFRYPVAITKTSQYVFVLDRGKASITYFSSTAFFNKVQEANLLFEKGLYKEALSPWNEVLKECNNYTLAYTGIGKALFQQGDYGGAMKYYRQNGNQADYSEAFKYYRLNLLRDHFSDVIYGIIIIIVLGILFKLFVLKYAKAFGSKLVKKIPERIRFLLRFPGYCMKSPFTGFEEMKEQNASSCVISIIIVLLWFIITLLNKWGIAFVFNKSAIGEVKVNIIFLSTVVLYSLCVISNLGLRTFMAGRGTLREIGAVMSYSLLPYAASILLNVGLSYLITQEESIFMTAVTFIGLLWSAIMLFAGIKGIHEYSAGETIKALLITVLGVALIVFLMVLFYSSLQQAFSWLGTVFSELSYRYL